MADVKSRIAGVSMVTSQRTEEGQAGPFSNSPLKTSKGGLGML